MTDKKIDELLQGQWTQLPRADGSLGYALFREGFKAVVIPDDKEEFPWAWHIGDNMCGVAVTPMEGMQEVEDILELLKAGKLV